MTQGGNTPSDSLSWPEDLTAPLQAGPRASRYWVALSGGLDSTLLLHVAEHVFASSGGKLAAIHINHQLQPNAGETEKLCRSHCERLGVPLMVERVDVVVRSGTGGRTGGLEDAARQARYDVFARILGEGEVLLMAHHGGDQAETVLFRLIRGSGVRGLGGMPETRGLGAGQLVRPWLEVSRERLQAVAEEHGIGWVEDPSNVDQRYDRNFLRQGVLPLLKSRWPSLEKRVAHSARACREQSLLADRLAQIHLQLVAAPGGGLSVERLQELAVVEQKNLLRWWLSDGGFRLPEISSWEQVLGELIAAAEDRAPELRGEGFVIRRFAGVLYRVVPGREVPTSATTLLPGQSLCWGDWRLKLDAVAADEANLPAPEIEVRRRVGGERIRTSPDGPARMLKKWLQEKRVPPWQRDRIPLFFKGGELIGVGGMWLSDEFSGEAPASGWRIVQEREFD